MTIELKAKPLDVVYFIKSGFHSPMPVIYKGKVNEVYITESGVIYQIEMDGYNPQKSLEEYVFATEEEAREFIKRETTFINGLEE